MKTPFIIDSCVFISLKNQGYTFDDKSNIEFWDYLVSLAKENYIKVPESVFQELEKGNDKLGEWAKKHKSDLRLETSPHLYGEEYPKVIQAYENSLPNGLSDTDLEWIGERADPYIIAHAIKESGTVVTCEIGRGVATDIKHVKIPTICEKLHVPCIFLPKFIWNIAQKKMLP